jgi:electron transfer flavoprotein alpha subunit
LLTVAPHAVDPVAIDGGVHEVRVHAAPPEDEDSRVRLAHVEPTGETGVSLPEARVVIGGGRGVGSADGFSVLEDLAGLLGAAIGVSRAVTSAGWRPHAEQIGQTGERIAPDLYVACGISGASQHLVGCAGAKHVLAINTDPDAPIMARADHAVIGDLHEVLPAIASEIRSRLGAR